MQHAGPIFQRGGERRHPRGEDVQHVVAGVAVVDDHRQTEVGSQGELRFEGTPLLRFWRAVPVVVQPDLTNRDDLGVCCHVAQRVQDRFVEIGAAVGMDANRCVHARVGVRQLERCARAIQIGARVDDARHAGLGSLAHDVIPKRVVSVEVEVAVRIDQVHAVA